MMVRPVPPEYPRRVPDIDFDQDEILPGTVVYAEDSDEDTLDAEELANHRAAKRRRIQAHAHAYLRGENPFILSATLRGPFENGWCNPWAKKNGKRRRETSDEESAVSRARKLLRQDDMPIQTPTRPRQAVTVQHQDPFAMPDAHPSKVLTPEQKVENWLRRTAPPQHRQLCAAPASPTPKRPTSAGLVTTSAIRHRTPSTQVIAASSQLHNRAPVHQVDYQRLTESFDTIVPADANQSDPVDTHARLQDVLHDETEDPRQRQLPRSSIESDRAEAAIKEMRMISLPKDAAPRSRQNPFSSAVRHAARPSSPKSPSKVSGEQPLAHAAPSSEVEVKLKKLESTIDDQLSRAEDVPTLNPTSCREHQPDKPDTSELVPSTSATDARSSLLPPSAQQVPALQTYTSKPSTEMLQSAPLPAVPDDQVYSTAREEVPPARTPVSDSNVAVVTLDHCIEPKGTDANNHDPVNQEEVPSAPGELKESRAIPPKKLPSKKRKSAAFAVDKTTSTTNGSIKNALRVQKRTKSTRTTPCKPSPPPQFHQPEADMDTSIEQFSPSINLHSPSQSKKRNRPPVKSILKTSSANNTPAHSASAVITAVKALSSKSSSRQKILEEDIMVSGQNGLLNQDNDDDFDLDGAINEMGSFLSTWDAERSGIHA